MYPNARSPSGFAAGEVQVLQERQSSVAGQGVALGSGSAPWQSHPPASPAQAHNPQSPPPGIRGNETMPSHQPTYMANGRGGESLGDMGFSPSSGAAGPQTAYSLHSRPDSGSSGNLPASHGYGIMRGMSTPPPEGARPRGWQRSSRTPAASVQGDNALDENDNIKVVARIRPMNEREAHAGGAVAVTMADHAANCVQVVIPGQRGGAPALHNLAFHGCLGPNCKQADVLKACGVTQLLDAVLAGYHVTIFAYGQTGSGKTFTMSGREDVLALEDYAGDSDDGIVTRSVLYLFDQIAKAPHGCKYTIKASYCEIYNEQLYDLLKFNKQPLPVKWEPRKGFHVPGLYIRECSTVRDMMQVISRGMHHRKMGSHELNLESSRSHSIMTLYCEGLPDGGPGTREGERGITRLGKVSFVDLAGSERLKDSKSSGDALKETSSINRSLFTLGKVISALADNGGEVSGSAHIPYRDSKLTKLLMDSLGGSALALMIACCSPAAAHAEETLSTLSYALRAKNICNRPTIQMDPQQATIASLSREVQLLRAENAYLRDQVTGGSPRSGTTTPGSVASYRSTSSRLPSITAQQPPPYDQVSHQQGSVAAGSNVAEPGNVQRGGSPTRGESGHGMARRLNEAEALVERFSRENERLALEVGKLRSGRQHVDHDYKSALEEVDWLKGRLENLETTLIAHAGDGATLGRSLNISLGSRPESGGSMGSTASYASPSGSLSPPQRTSLDPMEFAYGDPRRPDSALSQGSNISSASTSPSRSPQTFPRALPMASSPDMLARGGLPPTAAYSHGYAAQIPGNPIMYQQGSTATARPSAPQPAPGPGTERPIPTPQLPTAGGSPQRAGQPLLPARPAVNAPTHPPTTTAFTSVAQPGLPLPIAPPTAGIAVPSAGALLPPGPTQPAPLTPEDLAQRVGPLPPARVSQGDGGPMLGEPGGGGDTDRGVATGASRGVSASGGGRSSGGGREKERPRPWLEGSVLDSGEKEEGRIMAAQEKLALLMTPREGGSAA